MNWPVWTFVLNAISLLVFPIVYFVWKNITEIRVNELHGIDERLNRIESKIDAHLQYHLTKDRDG